MLSVIIERNWLKEGKNHEFKVTLSLYMCINKKAEGREEGGRKGRMEGRREETQELGSGREFN